MGERGLEKRLLVSQGKSGKRGKELFEIGTMLVEKGTMAGTNFAFIQFNKVCVVGHSV